MMMVTRFNKVFTVPLDNLIHLTNAKHPWKQLCNDAVCFKTANICYSDPPVILGGDDKQNQTISAVVVFDPKQSLGMKWLHHYIVQSKSTLCCC